MYHTVGVHRINKVWELVAFAKDSLSCHLHPNPMWVSLEFQLNIRLLEWRGERTFLFQFAVFETRKLKVLHCFFSSRKYLTAHRIVLTAFYLCHTTLWVLVVSSLSVTPLHWTSNNALPTHSLKHPHFPLGYAGGHAEWVDSISYILILVFLQIFFTQNANIKAISSGFIKLNVCFIK